MSHTSTTRYPVIMAPREEGTAKTSPMTEMGETTPIIVMEDTGRFQMAVMKETIKTVRVL